MKKKHQRGAQIIEFAFVFPFLCLVLLLIVDFGFLTYNKAIITNASREAARSASVLTATPWSITNVTAVACNYTKNNLISTASGTRNPSCTGTADPVIVISNPNGNVPPKLGDPITVQMSYAYSGFLLNKKLAWLPGATMPNLTAASTMNHE